MSIEDLRNMSIEELKSNEEFMSEVAKEYESTLEEFLSSPPKMIKMAVNEYLQKFSEINLDVQQEEVSTNKQDTIEELFKTTKETAKATGEAVKIIQELTKKVDMLQKTVDSQGEQLKEQGEHIKEQDVAMASILENNITMAENLVKKKTEAEVKIYALTDDGIFDYDKDETGKDSFQKIPVAEEILEMLNKGEVYKDYENNAVVVPIFGGEGNITGAVLGENVKSIDEFVKTVQDKNSISGKAVLGNMQNISHKMERTELNTQINYFEHQSKTDAMTQLLNKAGKTAYIKKEVLTSVKEGEPISIILIDGDKFKDINEKYGHAAGDAVLKKIAEVMKECSRDSDAVVRDGGDEFMIIAQCDGLKAYEIAERIRKAIEECEISAIDREENTVKIKTTVSAGVAEFHPQKAVTIENITQQFETAQIEADGLLDAAKKKGQTGLDEYGRQNKGKNIIVASEEIRNQKELRQLMNLPLEKIAAHLEASPKDLAITVKHAGEIPSETFNYLIDNCKPFKALIEGDILEEQNTSLRPTITCEWSESDVFENGKTYSVEEFDRLMREADMERHDGWQKGLETYGSNEAWREQDEEDYFRYLGYDKTEFTVNMPDGTTITERQDIGDGYGGVIDFLRRFGYEQAADVLENDIVTHSTELLVSEKATPQEQTQKSFAEQVDEVLTGIASRYNDLKVCDTPEILLQVGCEQLPIFYTQRHLRDALKQKGNKGEGIHHHGLTVEQIKAIPELLESPVAIYDSISRNDSIVVLTSSIDNENKPIVCIIKPNGEAKYNLEVMDSNFLLSTYGHDNIQSQLDRATEQDKVLYIEKNKSQELFRVLGLQLSKGVNNLDSNTIIHQSHNIVKGKQEISSEKVETYSTNPEQSTTRKLTRAEQLYKDSMEMFPDMVSGAHTYDIGEAPKASKISSARQAEAAEKDFGYDVDAASYKMAESKKTAKSNVPKLSKHNKGDDGREI